MAIFRDRGTPEVGAAVNFAVAIMFMAPDGTMQVGTN
jgi:hypothetical protein